MVGLCIGQVRGPNIGLALSKWASRKFNDGKVDHGAATLDERQVLWKQESSLQMLQ